MGGQWPEDEAVDRLAAKRAWLLGIGTRIETGDDELRHLASLKAVKAKLSSDAIRN